MSRKFEYYKDLFGKAFTVTVLLIGATVSSLKTGGLNFWSIVGIGTSIASLMATFLYGKKYKTLAEEEND